MQDRTIVIVPQRTTGIARLTLHPAKPRRKHFLVDTVPAAPPTRFAHSNPSPGKPVPMDIDTAQKAKATPDTCRRCGKTGHWAKDCDLRFDVRYMDTDELERELENKFAAKDVASAEPPVEEEEELSVEDFVSRSG